MTAARPRAFEAGSRPTASTARSSRPSAVASSAGHPEPRRFDRPHRSTRSLAHRNSRTCGARAGHRASRRHGQRGRRRGPSDARHERSHATRCGPANRRPRLRADLHSCERRVHARSARSAGTWCDRRTGRVDAGERRVERRPGTAALWSAAAVGGAAGLAIALCGPPLWITIATAISPAAPSDGCSRSTSPRSAPTSIVWRCCRSRSSSAARRSP